MVKAQWRGRVEEGTALGDLQNGRLGWWLREREQGVTAEAEEKKGPDLVPDCWWVVRKRKEEGEKGLPVQLPGL